MQKRLNLFITLLIIILSVSAFSGCGSKAASNLNTIDVKVAKADKHKIDTKINITGVLVPEKTVNIVSKISGQVLSMGYDVGSSVKTGDTLITLETKALNAQLQQAQAALLSAQTALQAAQNQADQVKINMDAVKNAYNRTKALYDAGAATQVELEDISNKLAIAQKQYELASGPSQNQARAAVSTAQANINSIKVQLENSVITSPITGVITNRNINPGEIASPGIALLTIADTSTLKLKGTVSQENLPLLKVGQSIDVTVDIYPEKVFKGQISSIGPMAVSSGKYFPIEISIKNTGDIKAGLSAHASISTVSDEGIVVPSTAVIQDNGQNYVYIIKNNIALKRAVETGISNGSEIEITKGLNAGEQVAITNVNNLFDNISVSVDQ